MRATRESILDAVFDAFPFAVRAGAASRERALWIALVRFHARLRLYRSRFRRDVPAELVRALLRRGDELVDVGAAMGTIVDAGLVARSHVTAIEPNPVWIERLRAYPSSIVEVVEVAVDTDRADRRLYIPTGLDGQRNNFQASLRDDANAGAALETAPVSTAPLDELARGATVLKIDVEGAELEVLQSGLAMIKEALPAVVIEVEQRHHPNEQAGRTFEVLTDLGYRGFFPAVDGARTLCPIDDFRFDRDQRVELLLPGARRFDRRYVNNFLFVHPSKLEDTVRRLRRYGWRLR